MFDFNTALQHVFTYKNLVHAVAGATGSVVSLTALFPLDTVRTRLQVDDKIEATYSPIVAFRIFKKEGLVSLYRGWKSVMTSLCISMFVYFYIYNFLKTVSYDEGEEKRAIKDLILAFTAGVVNVMVTMPLWVANTRLKLQGVKFEDEKKDEEKDKVHYNGIIDCWLKIIQKEGLLALWSGTIPSIILVSAPAINFMVYESQKRYMQDFFGTVELAGYVYFVMGGVAKVISTVSTYPMQYLQTQLRSGRQKTSHFKDKSTVEILQELIKKNGFFGLFKGLEAKLMQTVLMAALMFLTYEKLASFIFNMFGLEYTGKRH